jgi:hypothetical protein
LAAARANRSPPIAEHRQSRLVSAALFGGSFSGPHHGSHE